MSARFFDFLRVILWEDPVGSGPLSPELCALSCVTILQWKGLATPTANLEVHNAVIENCKVLDVKKTYQ